MSFDIQKIPRHVAIIMDGNSRWAKGMGLPQWKGHESGMQAAKNIVDVAIHHKIQYLTLYAFSIENWNREKSEVDVIMSFMRQYMSEYAKDFIERGVKIIFNGDLSLIDSGLSSGMRDIERSSEYNKVLTLIIAVSYSARNEIREAAMNMVKDSHKIDTNNRMIFDEYINKHNIPDPDLLIRTGGEYRLSNFMLWQIAYTELYFSKKLWPSFGEQDLLEAIEDFNLRERRYGRR